MFFSPLFGSLNSLYIVYAPFRNKTASLCLKCEVCLNFQITIVFNVYILFLSIFSPIFNCAGMIYITHHSSLLYRFMQTVRYQFTLHPDPFVMVCFLCGPLPTQEQHSFFFIFRRAAHMLAYCQLFYSLLILFSFFFSYVLGSQQSWRCCIFPLSQSWLSSLPVLYCLFYYQLYWRLKTSDVGRPHF